MDPDLQTQLFIETERNVEEWVIRGMQRWPNVPALYGWLRLTRRGRWLLKSEPIGRPQIIEAINHNYACDAQGRWFFQNGPQRGYMQLEYAPFVLHSTNEGGSWCTHTNLEVTSVSAAYLDEQGAIVFATEHGAGVVADDHLDWILRYLTVDGNAIDETQLAAAIALPSGATTPIKVAVGESSLPLLRLNNENLPSELHFVRDPQPLGSEPSSVCDPNVI